jgi:hypothetical protein
LQVRGFSIAGHYTYRAVPNRAAPKNVDEFGLAVDAAPDDFSEGVFPNMPVADRNALRREKFLRLPLELKPKREAACRLVRVGLPV